MNEQTGAHLKKIRLAKGLSLEEAHKQTRIHTRILKALEGDSLTNLSPVYVRSFLKIYCRFLGVDPKDYIADYQETARAVVKEAPAAAARPKEKPAAIQERSDISYTRHDERINQRFIGAASRRSRHTDSRPADTRISSAPWSTSLSKGISSARVNITGIFKVVVKTVRSMRISPVLLRRAGAIIAAILIILAAVKVIAFSVSGITAFIQHHKAAHAHKEKAQNAKEQRTPKQPAAAVKTKTFQPPQPRGPAAPQTGRPADSPPHTPTDPQPRGPAHQTTEITAKEIAPAQESSTAKESSPKPAVSGIRLGIRARAGSWVSLKVDGKVVFHRVLEKGRFENWQAKEKMELSLGNAGAVELEVNGRLFSNIGRRGQALKNIIITREGLNIGR